MKNRDIITLVNGGFLAATAHTLPVEHFYKWHRFKRDISKVNEAIGAEQADLLQDCGLDPTNLDDADPVALEKFSVANNALLNEESGVTVKSRIPFDFYKDIYDENRRTLNGQRIDIFSNVDLETVVLANLFEPMEE